MRTLIVLSAIAIVHPAMKAAADENDALGKIMATYSCKSTHHAGIFIEKSGELISGNLSVEPYLFRINIRKKQPVQFDFVEDQDLRNSLEKDFNEKVSNCDIAHNIRAGVPLIKSACSEYRAVIDPQIGKYKVLFGFNAAYFESGLPLDVLTLSETGRFEYITKGYNGALIISGTCLER